MAFREVRVFEVREVLRLFLRGEGLRSTERLVGVDRKTVRRYLTAAEEVGLVVEGGEEQLTDAFVALVVDKVRPCRREGRGAAWAVLVAHAVIVGWLKTDGLTVVKAHELLARRGIVVPQRTLHRYALEVCDVGRGRRGSTVRVDDGQPGDELQVDFGRLGLMFDAMAGRQRVCQALIFTPVVSRYSFVWLTFSQSVTDVIAGFEAAWAFYGGVFATVIPDNLKAVVDQADALAPRLNQAFVEYAQSRGFVIDPARVRSPQDKPRVERVVPFVRQSFFAGETFVDRNDAQRRAEDWCRERAGMRIHGTIQARPAEVFRVEELPVLRPAPPGLYDVPIYATAKVHRDHHIEVAKALYSVPGNLIGARVDARRPHTGAHLPPKPAGQSPSPPTTRTTINRPHRLAVTQDRVHAARPRTSATHRRRTRTSDRRLRRRAARHPVAMDPDAPRLRPVGAGQEMGCEPRRGRLRECARPRSGEHRADSPDARARHRTDDDPTGATRDGDHRPVRPRRRTLRREHPPRRRRSAMSAPTVTPELRALLRRVKLGRCLDTLPERLALAQTGQMGHGEFLELVLADEVTRRENTSADRRAHGAGLDPTMTLDRWDDTAKVTYDHHVWNELCSLRFIDGGHNAVIMGPVGVGKTFLATALGHAAIRRRYSVHFERGDRLLKRLRASRLDNSHDAEMRKLLRVDLLIIDDFALQALDALDTADVYELIVERHRAAATVVTSNREPIEWLGLMADALLAQSAIDRLQSAAHELVLDGESYRQRQKPGITTQDTLDQPPPARRTSRRRR